MITSMFWTLAMNNQSNDTLKNHIQHLIWRGKIAEKNVFVFKERLNTKADDKDFNSEANIYQVILRRKMRNTQPNCRNSTILHNTNT